MPTTYQDVVRANGGVASWALAESSGADLAPWLGGQHLTVTGTIDYQQPGPFPSSFAVGLHVGSRVGFPYVGFFAPPITWEVWVNFPTTPNAGNQILHYNGNNSGGGAGAIIIRATNEIQWHAPAGPTPTGKSISIGAWHLLTFAVESGNVMTLYIDGAFATRAIVNGGTAIPAQVNYGGDSSNTANTAFSVAYPTIYGRALTAEQAYAQFLASTDPASAIAWTSTGGGSLGATNETLLQQILDAVTIRAY